MEEGSENVFSPEELELAPVKYEYLDHTADVQIHSWGETVQEAFEQSAVAMFGYMTELEYVQMTSSHDIEAEGHDMLSLLFHFLDELLFMFCAEPFLVARKVKILEFDRENWKVRARSYGEEFDIAKHPQGTEVKAITYSNMQVHEEPNGKTELFVIVDI